MCILHLAQSLLHTIILPREIPSTGASTYTTTHRNKNVIVDKIKHIFIVLVLPTKSIFKHLKKHAVHNIQILAWGPYARGAPGQLVSVPMR